MIQTRYILATFFLLLIINTYAQKNENNSITDSIKITKTIVLDSIVTHKDPQFILNYSNSFSKNNYIRYRETLMKYESTYDIFAIFGVLIKSIIFLTKDEKVVYFEMEFDNSTKNYKDKFITNFNALFDDKSITTEEYYIYYYFKDDYFRVNKTSLRFKYMSRWAKDIKTKTLSNQENK